MNRRSVLALNKRILYYIFILVILYPWLDGCVAKRTYIDESTRIKFVSGRSLDSLKIGWESISPTRKQFSNIRKELQKAFNKYPDNFLIHYLDMIIIYAELNYQGVEYAGSLNMPRRCIFVTLRDGLSYVENVFHHELNTILLEKECKLFDAEKWSSCNPEDFSYWDTTRGCEYVRTHGTSQPWVDTTYFHQGFTSKYSMTSLDNDLSRYAEALFMSEKEFWDAFDEYERVREKARLTINFYNKLHPMFTEEYFRGPGNQQGVKLEE